MKPENEKSNNFCEMNKLEHLILKPTCFKGLFPSTIYLILSSYKQNFMKSDVYETGITAYHKIIFSGLRKTFAKGTSKTVFYRYCKNYDQNSFKEAFQNKIS